MTLAATVVGSGPNGLAAAIVLAQAGLHVEVREAAETPGGALRSAALTLPGFLHDSGASVFPLGVGSPFFATLPLAEHGMEWVFPPAPLAHPLDDGTAVLLERSLRETTRQFPGDAAHYADTFQLLAEKWRTLARDVLAPLRLPRHPLLLAHFGVRALQPASMLAQSTFLDPRARALFAGQAAHSALPLTSPLSAAFGLLLGAAGHAVGWPIARGGSSALASALIGVLRSLGGQVITAAKVKSLDEIKGRDLILCDVTPRQFLQLARDRLDPAECTALCQYRYGPGVFKVDWALRQPIPWRAPACLRSATVHLGGSMEEIAASEHAVGQGRPPQSPFLILTQPSLFDPSRAPAGRHTAWAYCHVPNAWPGSMLDAIEAQVERFAPGFKDCILARSILDPAALEAGNPNLIGGDIGGGLVNWRQFVHRPTTRRYRTSLPGVYLCSSSTPPGGGAHGMCGYHAARTALEDLKERKLRDAASDPW